MESVLPLRSAEAVLSNRTSEGGSARQSGFGFEAGALPLSHVAQGGGGGVTGEHGDVIFGFVGYRVNAHIRQPLLEMGIPVIFYLVIRSFRQMSGYGRPPENKTARYITSDM
nr:hypothetical protein CUMW_064620 [Ipomoea trifida]